MYILFHVDGGLPDATVAVIGAGVFVAAGLAIAACIVLPLVYIMRYKCNLPNGGRSLAGRSVSYCLLL